MSRPWLPFGAAREAAGLVVLSRIDAAVKKGRQKQKPPLEQVVQQPVSAQITKRPGKIGRKRYQTQWTLSSEGPRRGRGA